MYVDVRGSGLSFIFFFFIDPAPTEIYTLPLHDALPICARYRADQARLARVRQTEQADVGEDAQLEREAPALARLAARELARRAVDARLEVHVAQTAPRSEEHTSELQSQSNLVCRLLLEK